MPGLPSRAASARMPAGEQYVTAREVADRVGLSADTILRYYRDGKIPGRRMPGQIRPVRFLWSEVEAAFNGIADQAAEQAREEWAGRVRGQAA
jgi:excisionase family DNA binding protein